MFPSWNPSQPEITDLISRYDAYTLKRLPVGKQEVLELFARYRNRKAMRAVLALRENASILDDHEIDVLLLTVHWEMQRLAEEFYHGHRVWALLRHIVAAIREAGVHETLHIIDVGCGIGYTIRWLAAKIPLADYNIELTGMDLNATLIAEANRLASAEHLPCQFFQADASQVNTPTTFFCQPALFTIFAATRFSNFYATTNSLKPKHSCTSIFSLGFLHHLVLGFFTTSACVPR
ncbi:MAG TPA: methyltransferase domain-containing protein [Candidatus Acidoferrum sp.]|nr:methyltransferase domain-containing protein [Candidatus Acidoferrum sp.]